MQNFYLFETFIYVTFLKNKLQVYPNVYIKKNMDKCLNVLVPKF